MAEEFEALLQAEAEVGSLESQGEFTIDLVKARAKAASYTLETGDWAVKIVQAILAAQRSKFEKIAVKCLADSTLFEFELPKPWSLDSVGRLLCAFSESSLPRSLRHLGQGLQAAGLAEGRQIWIRAFDEPEQILWNGDSVEIGAWEKDSHLMEIEISHLSAKESQSLNRVSARRLKRKRLLQVLNHLQSRILFSTSPLLIDGRRQGRQAGMLTHLFEQKLSPVGIGDPDRLFEVFSKGHFVLSARSGFVLHLVDYGLNTHLVEPRHESRVTWICDGVAVGCDSLDFGEGKIGVQAYVDATGLPLDLGGLSVREGPERQQLLTEVRTELRQTLLDLKPSQCTTQVPPASANRAVGVGTIAALGSGLLILGVAGLPLLASGTAFALKAAAVTGLGIGTSAAGITYENAGGRGKLKRFESLNAKLSKLVRSFQDAIREDKEKHP